MKLTTKYLEEQKRAGLIKDWCYVGDPVKGGDVSSLPSKKPRKAKYNNEKVEADGKKFDSKHEYEVYTVLRFREAAGEITDLQTQVKFELVGKQGKERPISYVADFTWLENGELNVGDAKSEITRKLSTYVMKRKLMLSVHGITIQEL
ncbi:MAG: DUF1064 domain-containing protein [Sphingobacteriales bacterium]|nr:MAG: DUF1064 domain-containing protein [Sphingobacteriales bacterium]